MHAFVVVSAALCAWLGAAGTVLAQDHTATEPSAGIGEPPEFIRIDDQLFDARQLRGATGEGIGGWDGQPRTAAPVDTSNVDRFLASDGLTFGGWDFGVIPVEFSPTLTEAQRAQFFRVCANWGARTLISCVPRAGQLGFLMVNDAESADRSSPCFSSVGQSSRLSVRMLNLGRNCWTDSVIYHEFGHALGLWHEHQRPDRDAYIILDLEPVPENARGNYSVVNLRDPLGPYDFLSIMHYRNNAFATEPGRIVMSPREGYGSYANSMGTSTMPTDLDHESVAALYRRPMRPLTVSVPLQAARTRFDRSDFLDAMERLHALYYSRMGLNREGGLSIGGGPDFLGIATWIFDVYLGARSRGYSKEQSFQMVVADVTQTEEWRSKHPGQPSLSRPAFTPVISFNRGELLAILNRLDAFYRSPEGLQRPNGLSLSGGPDFLGIAAWIFDIYLNERLIGSSPDVAWTRVVNAIRSTDEWKQKH